MRNEIWPELRHEMGYFNQAEVARMAGASGPLLIWHAARKRIPQPTHQLSECPRLYYTQDEANLIISFFKKKKHAPVVKNYGAKK